MKVITLKDIVKEDKKRVKITWKNDKTNISAYRDNHKEGFYHISKEQCLTKE